MDKSKEFIPTTSGTPQGSLISPSLSNFVLAGLEARIKSALPARVTSKTKRYPKGDKVQYSRKINVTRYADDVRVTCRSRHDAEIILKVINEFLAERGLKLNATKTKVTDVHKGFNFLGFKFKHRGPKKLVVTPSKEAQHKVRDKIREIRRDPKIPTPAHLIKTLNPVLRG